MKKSVGNLTVAYHFRFRQAPHDAVNIGQKKRERGGEAKEPRNILIVARLTVS